MKKLLFSLFAIIVSASVLAGEVPEADAMYLYATKDSQDLMLDVYEPREGSETTLDGKAKPTVIFIFGGGFKDGARDKEHDREWFGKLSENGYRVISIDYRLGLKDANSFSKSPAFVKALLKAIGMAVEDLFSATSYIIENAASLGVDPSNIVVSGSSAGAITALQAEYEIINRAPSASVLPDGFNYAGVMSFAGAIFSTEGKLAFQSRPCPIVMFQGTDDKLVPYTRIKFLNFCFGGSDEISKTLTGSGFPFQIFRFKGHGHELASSEMQLLAEEFRFLEDNVIRGKARSIDALVDDPDIPFPSWGKESPSDLYK